jgi:ribosomal protein L40E
MTRRRVEAADGVTERKRTALRALKDLEFDHALGKIGDKDYAELSARYREQAKAILREIEGAVLPQRARAEELARAYLAKRGTGLASVKPREGNTGAVLARAGERVTCTRCQASNEKDAVFCKGCGATLGEKVCVACATRSEENAAFCKKCGRPLGHTSAEKSDASR